jgi:hypothetical protein
MYLTCDQFILNKQTNRSKGAITMGFKQIAVKTSIKEKRTG